MVRKNKTPEPGVDRLAELDQLIKEQGLALVTESDYVTATRRIDTGSLALNMATGGGYPTGIIDVFGAESAGKSLISILAMAQVQRAGGIVVVWDAEHSYTKNTEWLKINGVDTSKIRWLKPRDKEGNPVGCETGFEYLETIIKKRLADLVVIDSIPALVPQDALDKGMTEHEILGRRASIITRFAQRSFGILDDCKTTIMCINQIRANVASGPAAAFAPKTKETSNFSLRHASSIRMQVIKMSKPKEVNGLPYSHRVQVRIIKNKVSTPYLKAEFDVIYTRGVDRAAEIADILTSSGDIKKSGAMYRYGDNAYRGRDALIEAIRQPALFAKAEAQAKSLTGKLNLVGVMTDEEKKSTQDSDEVELEAE